MLNTIIDFEVFDKFCKAIPKQIPEGSEEENELWNSFWRFLISDSKVVINNFVEPDYKDPTSIFLNKLTSGKNGTTFKPGHFKKPHNCKFPKNQNVQTVFFLKEGNLTEHQKYRNNNGFVFGFQNDYMDVWKDLSFQSKEKVLHKRKVEEKIRFSWEKLSSYLPPFSDVILMDKFIFSNKEDIKEKIQSLIKSLDNATPVEYNLLIVTDRDKFDIEFSSDIKRVYNYLNDNALVNSHKAKLGIIHSRIEHERYLFFNYLEVEMGKFPDSSANPTKFRFLPYTERKNFIESDVVLSALKRVLNGDNVIDACGNLNNRLLNSV
jgi:hypothetical protein